MRARRTSPARQAPTTSSLLLPAEQRHLRNARQLTFGGQNAEAYFSADDKQLIFQHAGGDVACDQMYIMPVSTPDGSPPKPRLVSTGKGRTTCGYFFPSGDRILYSSTHLASAECPPKPDYSHGYVWPVYASYDIFTARPDGSDLKRLTDAPGYDAEATISRDGKKIVFTSMRDGDLDIYTMNADGTGVRRLTHRAGLRRRRRSSRPTARRSSIAPHHPRTPEESPLQRSADAGRHRARELRDLGHGRRRLPQAPDHPQRRRQLRALLASGRQAHHLRFQHGRPGSRNFDLYIINADGSGQERITFHPDFDAFPMFSSDGKKLVWASNRNGKQPHETNIFIADWVE